MYPYTYPPNYKDVIGLKLYSNKHVNGFKYGLIREKYPLMEDIILVIGARGGIELLDQAIDFTRFSSNLFPVIPTLIPTIFGGKHEPVS